MPYIEKFILPLAPGQLTLFRYLIILVSILHITFISVFLGTSLFSVIFNLLGKKERNPIYSRFSNDLLKTDIYNKYLGAILGVMPLLTLIVLYSQILYGSGLSIDIFLFLALAHLLIALVLIYVYQHTFPLRDKNFLGHISSGILGIALLLAAYFIFVGTMSLMADFEKRSFIRFPDPYSLLFSWNVIARFIAFLSASLAITGGVILFYFFKWSEEGENIDEEYGTFIKNFSAGIPLPCIMILSIMLFWDLISLPTAALSAGVYGMTLLVILLLMFAFYILYSVFKHSYYPHLMLYKSRMARPVLILFLLIFSILVIKDNTTIKNAIQNHSLNLIAKSAEAREKLSAEKEMVASRAGKGGEKIGENVFNSRCVACHRFDQRLVGPPLGSVLPKYQDNLDQLAAFITNPTKKNPGYPPMPKLGLNKIEATEVARYVLGRMK